MSIEALYRRSAVTLADLRYLVALADQGHFRHAAELCSVTQPTLSAQVRKLEDCLGVKVFERTPKGVQITQAGERLVAQARRVLEEAEKLLHLAGAGSARPIRLGIIATLAPYALPWLVRLMRGRWPDLGLVVREDLTVNLLEGLKARHLDALLLSLPVDDPALDTIALFDESFSVIVPGSHPLSVKDTVEEDDLCRFPVLLLAEGHCLRAQALDICRRRLPKAMPDDDYRATSLETIRQMVAAGFGCSLLPALAVEQGAFGAAVVARPFAPPVPYRRIGLVQPHGHPQAAALHILATLLRDNLPGGLKPVWNDAEENMPHGGGAFARPEPAAIPEP